MGVAAGAAPRGRFGPLAAVAAAGVALLIVAAVLPYVIGAAVFVAGAALGAVGARRLSASAVPAAVLATALLAFVPALGYLEALAAPVLGWRLRRRAAGRYAGLRVLAKD